MALLVVGASARAAVHSAGRAGLACRAFDLFADRDSGARRIDRAAYPDGFEAILAQARDADAWLYTGALENHPELIDRMARLVPLWGISGDALRGMRDPTALAAALARKGLPAPGVRDRPEGLPRDGSWLVKPRASAGGRSIRPLMPSMAPTARPMYYQQRVEGTSLAALFVGDGRGARLLGVTRQLTGRPGGPFAYVGSLGPWPVAGPSRAAIVAVGEALAGAFAPRGFFGVDLILDRDGRAWPVEVNPRYTASVEVLEWATGHALLAEHRRVFERVPLARPPGRARPPAVVGKAILFAARRSRLPAVDAVRAGGAGASGFAVPRVADLPAWGEVFDPGDPVLTVLARGATLASCRARLDRRLARWGGRLVDA